MENSLFALGGEGGIGDRIEALHETYESLSAESRALLEEALLLVQDKSSGVAGVARVKEIFESNDDLDVNLLFPQTYGETLLALSIGHSVAMMRTLLEAGADPSVGNEMLDETPLDVLLEFEDRTEEQEQMLELLREYGGENSPDPGQQIQNHLEDHRRELLWAIGQDPDEWDQLPDFIQVLYLEQLRPELDAVSALSNEERRWKVQFQKNMAAARKRFEELPKESQALMKEAYKLLKTTTDDEPKPEFDNPAQAVARVKEILFCGAEGISPNLLSPTDGESLLFLAVTNWFLDEWKKEGEQPMLDLVKILLQAGADPNLENVIDRDTALDYMDYEIEFSDLTAEQSEIIRLLTEAGAKVLPRDDMGSIVGERGEGISRHEQARQQAMSTLSQ